MSPRLPVFTGGPVRPGLVLAALLLAALPASGQWPEWLNRKPQEPVYPEVLVDAAWLRDHRNDRSLRLLDARDGQPPRIPGAQFVAPSALPADPTALRNRLGALGIPATGTVVCYTDSRAPLAAGELFRLLELAGHRGARILNGGIEAWTRAGGPTETGTPGPVAPALFAATPDSARLATTAWVNARFGRAGTTMVDTRPEADWSAGHVPHSLPFDFDQLVNEDGLWMDGPSARPILATLGPRDREYVNLDDEFVVLAAPGSPHRVHPYAALRIAGVGRVRWHAGGFGEWSRTPGTPVTRIVPTAEVVALMRKAHGRTWHDRPVPGLIVLDLRHEREFAAGHLPGAILLPPDRFEAELDSVVAAHWPGADRATIPFLVYCYGPTCIRSRNATTMAARHGFHNLLWDRDGPMGWQGAGEPLFTSP